MHCVRTALIAVGFATTLGLPGVTTANDDLEKQIANPKNWAMQAVDMYN